MIEFDQVNDEVNALFLATWNAGSAAIAGYVPEIRWQGVQYRDLPDGSKFWVRLSKQTVFEEQATLSTCEGVPGQRKYTASGLVFVQIFCPKSNTQAFELGQKLAKLARNAFRGKSLPGKVWFRNTRINNVGDEDQMIRLNVIADYYYNEIA